jgi:hypothetical protein
MSRQWPSFDGSFSVNITDITTCIKFVKVLLSSKSNVVYSKLLTDVNYMYYFIYLLAASAARGASPQNHVYFRFMFVFVVI